MPKVPKIKMKTRIKVQGFLIFIAVVMLIFYSKYLLADYKNQAQRIFFDIAGTGLFLTGYYLRIAARGYKAELGLSAKPLAVKGLYALTRNPMYLGTLLIGLGITFLLLKWWLGLIFLSVYLIIYIPQIKKEEKRLFALFGPAFESYCKLTPRFFPRARALLHPEAWQGIKFRLAWIKKESNSLVIAIIFIFGIKIWVYLK